MHCLVCREKMSLNDDNGEDATDLESQERMHVLVATKCGHLFHRACLVKSCSSRRANQLDDDGPVSEHDVCPSCSRAIEIEDCLRIFPEELPDDGLDLSGLGILGDQELRNKIGELSQELYKLKATTSIQEQTIALLKKNGSKLKTGPSSSSSRPNPAPLFGQGEFYQEVGPFVGYGFTIESLPAPSPDLTIKISDAIMWITDENPNGHAGVVKWLGKINSVVFAGVEFDEAIGNNFMEAGGQVLFNAGRPDHGRLVPVRSLMLYKHFTGHDYFPPDDDE